MIEKNYDIIFYISHMGLGGAQRVASYLLNYWSNTKKVCLITLFGAKNDLYKLNSSIDRIEITQIQRNQDESTNEKKTIKTLKRYYKLVYPSLSNYFIKIIGKLPDAYFIKLLRLLSFILFPGHFKSIFKIRKILKNTNSHLLISFIHRSNIISIISAHDLRDINIIISERNDPELQILKRPWESLRKRLYNCANLVNANSVGAINSMASYVHPKKLIYIPNPLPLDISKRSLSRKKENIIIGVGRLVKQKRFDLLIKAFSIIHNKIPEWSLIIVGDGPLKEELKEISITHGIESKVKLLGYQQDVFRYLEEASIISITSLYEGTPNSLMEAMCFNVAAIVSDSSPGPLELIKDGHNGYVFPYGNTEELSKKIFELATNEGLRLTFAKRNHHIMEKYQLENVVKQWEPFINSSNMRAKMITRRTNRRGTSSLTHQGR